MVSSQQNKHFLIAYIVQTGTWGLYVCVWRFNWWSVQHHQPLKLSIKNGHLNLLHTHTLSSAPYAVILHYQTSTELMPLPSTNICKQSQLPEKLQTDPGSPSFIPSPPLNSLHYYFPQRSSARSPTKHQFQIQILYQARFFLFPQIQQWEQNLERFNLDLFRMRCYLASLQGGELPNPKSLLAIASRPTKTTLGRLGIFSVSSFHALVRNT